jgi:hypothetical protein
MLNATEYALLLNESYANGGNAIPFPNVSGLEEELIGKMSFSTMFLLSITIFLSGSDKITRGKWFAFRSRRNYWGDKSGFFEKYGKSFTWC